MNCPKHAVRMKTYACLNCGRGLESAEFVHLNVRWSLGWRCPSCGAAVSLAGGAFIVLGVLILLLVPAYEAEFPTMETFSP